FKECYFNADYLNSIQSGKEETIDEQKQVFLKSLWQALYQLYFIRNRLKRNPQGIGQEDTKWSNENLHALLDSCFNGSMKPEKFIKLAEYIKCDQDNNVLQIQGSSQSVSTFFPSLSKEPTIEDIIKKWYSILGVFNNKLGSGSLRQAIIDTYTNPNPNVDTQLLQELSRLAPSGQFIIKNRTSEKKPKKSQNPKPRSRNQQGRSENQQGKSENQQGKSKDQQGKSKGQQGRPKGQQGSLNNIPKDADADANLYRLIAFDD
ncbi:MAG: hypothetical protein LBB11_02390, partial [Puniceicoccales bacterium]|nr:hypothetical protein [Puniceicoccales bacterium]